MADYFSKYKGRGGPAIDPGIVQMMGSIGESYARGIEKFGDEVGSAIAERAERKRQENATEFFLNLGRTTGVEDSVSYNKANDEKTQRVTEAEKRSAIAYENLKAAHAQTGERGDMGKANEIRDRIDDVQTRIGDITSTLFQKEKAIDKQKKKLADPIRLKIEKEMGQILPPLPRKRTPEEKKWYDVWDYGITAGMTSKAIKHDISAMQKEHEKLAKELPQLRENFQVVKKFWQMETTNPGSSKGMDAPKGSDEYEVALERLNIFRDLRDRAETRTRLKREELGHTIQIDPFPIPSLTDALPTILHDKPDALARLMNYDRPTTKSTLVESARNEVVAAELDLEKVLGEPELRRGDFQRPETDIEKVRRLYVDKKKYPKDFGEKVISFLQKTQGPQYKVVDINGAQYLLTNQGATLLGKDNAKVSTREKLQIDQAAVRRKESKENRADYDTDVKRIKEAISAINQKEYDIAGEGLNAEDMRRRKELQDELKSVTEEFKSAQGELFRDIGGDISDPYTDTDILQVR